MKASAAELTQELWVTYLVWYYACLLHFDSYVCILNIVIVSLFFQF